jgi:AraC family transcriptional regulator
VSTGTVCTDTLEVRGCKVIDARFPAGLRIAEHMHDGACVSVVVEGEFSERLMRQERCCARGSVLSKPPLEPHDDVFGRCGSRQLILELEPTALEAACTGGRPWDTVVHARAAEAEALARSLAREIAVSDPLTPLAVQGLTLELLVCVWRLQGSRSRRVPPAWLLRACEFVHDQFQTSFTLEQLAVEVGVHPAHLAREFRSHIGVSVGCHVRRLRVDWSKTQLLTTRDSLASIAVRAGFSDQSHFTRWFKRETGVTPQRYRSARSRYAVPVD